MLAEITYAKMSTFLVVSLVIILYHGLAYQNNVFNQTLNLFNYYLVIVSWRHMTAKRGGQQMLVCDKPDMAITVLACFVVILTEHYCVLASFKKIYQKKAEVWLKVFSNSHNYSHACHTRFAVFFPPPSCCVSSRISVASMELRAWQWPQNCFI